MPENMMRCSGELDNLPVGSVIYNYVGVTKGDKSYFKKLTAYGTSTFWYRCNDRGVIHGVSDRYHTNHIMLPAFEYAPPKARTLEEAEIAISELCEALRFTVEYVGVCTLPPVPGWSWYNALKKYAPDSLESFEKQWTLFRATERDNNE